jgi:hypothetical protein
MKTVNSLSGGKTSSYIAANYPADYNVFALVRIEDEKCKFPDKKIRQEVEDRIQAPFIATAEDDMIIYTMLDLEQYIGQKINWVTGKTFDEVINSGGGTLPNVTRRFCTTEMKLNPIFEWWRKEIEKPVEMRLGFRANETRRAKRNTEKTNDNGLLEMKAIIGKRGTRNAWGMIEWQKPVYPLIKDAIYKDDVESFWKDKPVRFARINNCVGCFHQSLILTRKRFEWHPNKMEWFSSKEGVKHKDDCWRNGIDKIKYSEIKKWNLQQELFDDDFNECDSGYCGL